MNLNKAVCQPHVSCSRGRVALRYAALPVLFFVAVFAGAGTAQAQAGKGGSDTIVFTNGDTMTGKLLREVDGKVTFHSDIAGDVTVPWDKIKSIHSSQKFAVIRKGVRVNPKTADGSVPQGVVTVEGAQVKVKTAGSAAPVAIPVASAEYLIDEGTYEKEIVHTPGFLYGWNGTLGAGLTVIQATQNSRAFNGQAALVRQIPTVSWLSPRNRTTVDFLGSYGTVSQTGVPTVKTNIIHAGAEYDWFLTPRLYALATAMFDHNYSQGLQLQQVYGGGLGWVAIKQPKQELDLKADVHYERQSFFVIPGVIPPPPLTPSRDLIGMDFGDTYMLKLPKNLLLNQFATIAPTFNDPSAYSAVAGANLGFPIYKRLGFSVGVLDNYLHTPAAGTKSNSFQFTSALTYTLK